jgi:hypothetical protein
VTHRTALGENRPPVLSPGAQVPPDELNGLHCA